MSREWEREAAKEVAEKAIALGFRAFISGSGTYGFYTDGERVVSFQSDLGGVSLSGNYKTDAPKYTGNGWRIYGPGYDFDLTAAIKCNPPEWAVKHHKWKLTTLEQHLENYQASSKYEEVSNGRS